MSEEFQQHLFDSFERERNSTISGIQGTGLGLAIVKQLVELMHGSIHVESRQGEGTRITIDVPHRIGQPPQESNPSAVSADPYVGLQNRRVLLTEDIEVNAMLATQILEMNGMIVERAHDGVECVDMVRAAEPGYYELILMDIQMPNMNGYEATRAIRSLEDAQRASIPIVAMTANAFAEDRTEAFAAGMNGHVAKPIDVPTLLSTLNETLPNSTT